jgi:hypothetical protein
VQGISLDYNHQEKLTMSSDTMPQSVIACNLSAIPVEERGQHSVTAQEVFACVEEVKEESNGYALRLPTDSALVLKVADFIANERLCCPFFEFTLRVTPNGGPIWLNLGGDESVKAFIKSELLGMLNPAAVADSQV